MAKNVKLRTVDEDRRTPKEEQCRPEQNGSPAEMPSTRPADSPSRLDVYVVNAEWDSTPHHLLTQCQEMLREFLTSHNLFILSKQQSITFLRGHPDFMGKDPLLVVIDPQARKRRCPAGFGVALGLGKIRWIPGGAEHPEYHNRVQVLAMIRMFLQIINSHDGSVDIVRACRKFNHRAGIKGAIQITMETLGQEAHTLAEA